jgi:soluble lytic murein transglycosylase-like protein
MRMALDYVSRRYHVSSEALKPIFATAQSSGHQLGLDPLLIVAVIGVESGFNPLSQSVIGAQGLMQVMPRFHADKLPDDAGELPFFDPVTNVQVGAQVLKESIKRYGGIEEGLQQFGGALGDPERRYAAKVLAERQRLQQAAQRLRTAA